VKCACINRGFKNGFRGSLDAQPVGDEEVGVSVFPFEGIGEHGENLQLFSSCLQYRFPYNLAKQNTNRRSVKDVKEHVKIHDRRKVHKCSSNHKQLQSLSFVI